MGVEEDVISTIGREIAVLTRLSTSLQKFIGVLDRSAVLLLRELQGRGPLGISTLAADLQLDISTASRQTAALEAKGLVERLTDPEDGRVSLLQITPLGEAQLQEVRQIYHRLLNELFEGWSEEDIRNFEGYLSRYNRAMIQRKK